MFLLEWVLKYQYPHAIPAAYYYVVVDGRKKEVRPDISIGSIGIT